MIQQPWGISVTGRASVAVEPDMAEVRLGINRMEGSPAGALSSVRSAISRVRQALADSGISEVRVSGLNVHTVWESHPGPRRVVGHQASASVWTRVDDLAALDTVIEAAVGAGADGVDQLIVDSVDRNEHEIAARAAAVVDAREKAEAVATAAGVTLGSVVHIQEWDAGAPRMERMMAAGSDFAAGDIEISVSLEVGYSIT